MCVRPITLKRKRPDGSFSETTVPCGKCHECLSKRHSAFALEAVLEARAASSMYFVTLTYNDKTVPIMGRRVFFDTDTIEPQECWFEKDSMKRELALRILKPDMSGKFNPLVGTSYVEDYGYCTESAWNEVFYTPSLRREDVRLWIKRCRVEYERQFGEKINLRYAFFGEYGEQTSRPHYHGILFNLSKQQADFLRASWEKHYGFTYFVEVPVFNLDGSPARVKVANYVSKYIAKDVGFPGSQLSLVEAPRRFSSCGFGTKCLTESQIKQMKSFTHVPI